MTEKRRLISRILTLLAYIETPANQSIIQQIRGLLYKLEDEV